jgi:hypothetical protein
MNSTAARNGDVDAIDADARVSAGAASQFGDSEADIAAPTLELLVVSGDIGGVTRTRIVGVECRHTAMQAVRQALQRSARLGCKDVIFKLRRNQVRVGVLPKIH